MPPMPTMPATPPALFPTYLIPSLPFRRRKSSTDSTISTLSTSSNADSTTSDGFSTNSSPPTSPSYLNNHSSHLRCARCASDLALSTQIISKGFTGRHGRAYLVSPHPDSRSSRQTKKHSTWKAKNDALPNLPNTYTHKPVPRQLVTGAHTVGDISCAVCGSVLGWKYVAAEEEGQKYKVGKFILETRRVCRTAVWEADEGGEDEEVRTDGRRRSSLRMPPSEIPSVSEEIEFDSQDEEECEDLFMGVWTPELAAKRRRARQFGRDED